jgi:hypothetical protein
VRTSGQGASVGAFEELRESLRDAAHREVRATRARRRRRQRIVAVIALALVGGGAAADATSLFDSGPAVPDVPGQTPRYAPEQGEQRQITAKLRVAGVPLPFGVAVYDTAEGRACALAGVVNGSALGDLAGGRFRPFAADRVGTCNTPGRATIDQTTVAGHVLVYGLAAARARSVALPELGRSFRLGPDRAFLFVVPERRPYKVDMRE